MDHGVQVSRVEVWAMAEGGRGQWPFDADELVVFMADMAIEGHSTSGVRSHRFLLNK